MESSEIVNRAPIKCVSVDSSTAGRNLSLDLNLMSKESSVKCRQWPRNVEPFQDRRQIPLDFINDLIYSMYMG